MRPDYREDVQPVSQLNFDPELADESGAPRRGLRQIFSNHIAEEKQRLCQRLLQDNAPVIVPSFTKLRSKCLRNTYQKLQALESELTSEVKQDERIVLDQATKLLEDLDKQFSALALRHQLEDPGWAAQHGLSLVHFTTDANQEQDDWILLSGDLGLDSKSIMEWDLSKLADSRRGWIREACRGVDPPGIAFKRRKTLLERQKGVLKMRGDIIVLNPAVKMMWAVLLSLGIAALICFLGVGIIATTTEFSPIFINYFFWIAIVWTLVSSTLLVAIVRAFDATARDCMSAFLAAVAIWLVVIQIGQTKLNGQLAQSGSS